MNIFYNEFQRYCWVQCEKDRFYFEEIDDKWVSAFKKWFHFRIILLLYMRYLIAHLCIPAWCIFCLLLRSLRKLDSSIALDWILYVLLALYITTQLPCDNKNCSFDYWLWRWRWPSIPKFSASSWIFCVKKMRPIKLMCAYLMFHKIYWSLWKMYT